jgi:hypothetical protein
MKRSAPIPATNALGVDDGIAEEGQGRLLAPGLAPTPSSAVSQGDGLGWQDTGRKSGLPSPRHPITGESTKKVTLRDFAKERGWDYRWKGSDECFTKGKRALWISKYQGSVLGGTVHESEAHGGMSVKAESLKDILDGVRCACDSFGKNGQDVRPNPTCPITHPPADYTHLDNGFRTEAL